MLCMLPASGVTYTRLAGEEGLKTFALQVFEQGNRGDIGVLLAPGIVLVFTKDAGNMLV
ncbi:hypothetical protein M976_00312 [Buttiauxella ferragutiae ATCC 51602]|uniref:Uncharacterized protein n=1 Tax=Buttiauxella ferragutiae ATCC 51602 TaxID=1354252 RepID=A0ABX2WDL3_9ENTR|nr:hypothetical protein M976_00312 [Buttiauxella ferragutiae ATCC 51602]